MSEVGSRRSEVGGRRCSQDIGNTFCIRSLPSFLIATVRDSAGHVARPSRSIDSLYPKAHRPPLAGLTAISHRFRWLDSTLDVLLPTFSPDQAVAALARTF
jgi:hypothetical protein